MGRYIERMCILCIFLLFSTCSCILVMLGADQYMQINQEAKEHFDIRTPVSYISNKVRQNDTYGAIQVIKQEGKDILVLSEVIGEQIYDTWIYEYEGMLRELYIQQGDEVALDWGVELLAIQDITFKMGEGVLEVELVTLSGKEQKVILGLRAGGMR
ncbi:MAG: DUF4860 domain-containing protein [Cellulosilyticaceae bacterium]